MNVNNTECFVSVDIETSGPIPGEFSLLSLGACLVYRPDVTFEVLLKPINNNADPEALKVTGFNLADLDKRGFAPNDAFTMFDEWVLKNIQNHQKPVFVGFNAGFDWSFVNYYFHKYLGRNPFGFAALDIKSLYMGAKNTTWNETKSSYMTKHLNPITKSNHQALDDAIFQAELFRIILKG